MKTRLGRTSPITLLTDDQIRLAISQNTTWIGVMRSFGFKRAHTDPTDKVKQRCAAAQISIDHLPKGEGGWNKGSIQDPLNNPTVEAWKRGEIVGHTGKTMQTKSFVRLYMCAKANHACQKCGWNKTNPITGRVPLEVNHIDGDHSNTVESNLEAICPNCHSLTPTFRALNKGNGRPGRK